MTIPVNSEPIFDVAQLAHVELLTPDLEGSQNFFENLLGMHVTARKGKSVYLRGYEELYHHSIQLTQAPQAGLGHVAWRARSPQALDRRVAAIEARGLGVGWVDATLGHGRAYRFQTPEGHPMELFWEVEYASPPPGKKTALRNRPQRRPSNGIPVRRIDHLNLMTADTALCRDFLTDVLGFRERERVEVDKGGPLIASWLSVTNLSHDIALVPEPSELRGRFHHVCLHYTSIQHLFDVAELARESAIAIEHGPGRHGIGGATFLYLMEPGGNRIEVMGDPGYMIFDPDWKTIVWNASEIAHGAAWTGSPMPDSFWKYGTPPVLQGAAKAKAAAA
jgi:catechol 2,3-dioxygenase